jgi:hypothetical protein
MKLKGIILALMTLLVVGGCGNSLYTYRNVAGPEASYQYYREIPVYMDKNFSVAEREALLQSMGEWNWTLNGYMKLVVKDTEFNLDSSAAKKTFKQVKNTGEGYLILKLNHDDPALEDVIEEGDGTLAFVNRLGHNGHIMVVIADRIGSRNLKSIVLHEFGHLLGASHVMARSLMYPSYSGRSSYRCVDKITAAQVANYQQIELSHLNYCSTPDFE